jgi:hypothetical protein
MRLFGSKRGESEVTELIMTPPFILAIVFGVIFLTLMAFVSKISVSRYYENTYLAVSGGLALEMMYPSSSILMFDSSIDTLGLTFNLSNGRSETYDEVNYPNATREEKAYYMFTADPSITVVEGLVTPRFGVKDGLRFVEEKAKLRFLKEGNEFRIGTPKIITPNFNKLTCPEFEKATGLRIEFVEDSKELERAEIKTIVKRSPITVLITKNQDYNNNVVVAYLSSRQDIIEQNMARSCSILNKLLSDTRLNIIMEISDTIIIPTDQFPALDLGDSILLEFRTQSEITNEIPNIKQLIENALT